MRAVNAAMISLAIASSVWRAKIPFVPITTAVTGLVPVTAVRLSGDIVVPVALVNGSDRVVKYAVNSDGTTLYQLQRQLYYGGKRFDKGSVIVEWPPFKSDQVRELAPHSLVMTKYHVPHDNVGPGQYELRLVYQIRSGSVDATKHGLTPMKHDQTIILDVVDK